MRLNSVQESLKNLQQEGVTMTNISTVTSLTTTSECSNYTGCPVKNQQCHSWQAVWTSPTTVELCKQCCCTHTHTHTDTDPHTCTRTPPAHFFAFPATWHHQTGVKNPASRLVGRGGIADQVQRLQSRAKRWHQRVELANGRDMPGWL